MEADAELVVDANAVLSGAVAFQAFETIPRRDAQLAEIAHPISTVFSKQVADLTLSTCTRCLRGARRVDEPARTRWRYASFQCAVQRHGL